METQIRDLKILVVDDEQVNVDVLRATLTLAGFVAVTCVTDPLEAVGLCADTEYDLILLDLQMPALDGFGVMERLRQSRSAQTPVIVITAVADQETRLKALGGGARDYITKPFSRKEALARTGNLLEMRLAQKQLKAQNDILEEKVAERTKELRETRLEIINRLGRAAEYKDNETGLHTLRMSAYSRALARGAGLDMEEWETIFQAAPMHDIGKIGVPDSILQKKGKLTADEWEIMKKHPIIGANILSGHPSGLLTLARAIAESHHERWDGRGYPYGLAGEDICMAGRIVAIADVFDALTSRRPYKKPWPFDVSMQYIADNGGAQFDPRLAGIFVSLKSEALEIYNHYIEGTQ